MQCAECFQDPCVCQTPHQAIRDTSRPFPTDAITKEEFGLDLFEAIACCGGILQLRQMRQKTPPTKIKPKQLKLWQKREHALMGRAKEITANLSDDQAADLVRRYPFILA